MRNIFPPHGVPFFGHTPRKPKPLQIPKRETTPKNMSLLFAPQPPLFSRNPTKPHNLPTFLVNSTFSPKLPITSQKHPLPVIRSSLSSTESDPDPQPQTPITDEWGEKTKPEPESETVSYSRFLDSDPPKEEDEWGGDGYVNGSAAGAASVVGGDDRVEELKRCLVDSLYGTEFGFRAGQEVRAEVLELVNQLEALNPTPAPVEDAGLLDGNWVLVYTAFSELLPLLATGATPLLKVEKISQSIDTSNLTIVNSTTLSGPFASFTFSASAAFEIRSSSRIQVEFKEGTFQPPEVKPTIDLPESVDLFGQKISLMPVQQSLSPLQEAVASISRTISGQPPLKLPIPGERTKSWLLITYLDKDMRISRGDGGLFVLVKEGSPLLN